MSRVMPPIPATAVVPRAWRIAGPMLLLMLAAVLLLYRETGLAMVGIWQRSDTFAHAFVVPPIALWLIWRQRATLAGLTPSPSFWFALPFGLAALGWMLGELVAVNALTQLALVGMLVSSVPLLLGWQVAGQIAFPLAFMFFAVPIGEFMMPALMEATADFTVAALRMSGIPVYREGLQFVIPSGNWSVVEACSGLRYLIASVMVGTLFAYLNYQSLRRRLVFIAVSILLPLLANWVRAYLIVMLGHLSSNELATGADHLVYGWVFFGVIMLAMFMIGARWAEPELPLPTAKVGVDAAVVSRPLWPAGVLALGLLAAPQLALHGMTAPAGERAVQLVDPALAGWVRQDAALSSWKPQFERPAGELHASFAKGSHGVGLHVAYYRHQGYDSKLVSSSNQIVRSEDKEWVRVAADLRTAQLGGRDVVWRSAELRGSGVLRLQVWQLYWIGGRLTANDVRAKFYGAVERLMGRGDDAASVIVYTLKDADNAGQSERVLEQFLRDNWTMIEASLQQTRASAR